MDEVDILAFLAARKLSRTGLAAAAGVTPGELEVVLETPGNDSEASRRIRNCLADWDYRHSAHCEGLILLTKSGSEIWSDSTAFR